MSNFKEIDQPVHLDKVLDESEIKFRQIFDLSPVGIVMVGLDKKFLQCNKAFSDSLGYTMNDIVGQTIEDLTYPEDVQIGMKEMISLINNEIDSTKFIKRYIRKDRQFIWSDVTISLIRDTEGHALYFLGIIQDITARKQTEDSLHINEQNFRSVFENSPIGKSMTQINGSLRINKAFSDILGYSFEELNSKKWQEITHPDDIQNSTDVIQSLMNGHESHIRYEKRYIHKNGNIVWTDVSTTLQRNEKGEPLFFITTIIDITEFKRIQKELISLNQDLENKVSERTIKLKDLSELNQKIIDSSSLGIFACHIDGPCVIANKAVATISGTTLEKMLLLNWRNLDTWKQNGLFDQVEKALATETGQTTEIHLRTNFGKVVWINYYITTFRRNAELHFLMMVEDITERKLAEEKFIRANNYNRSLIEASLDPLVTIGIDGKLTDVNNATEIATGYTRNELIGTDFSSYFTDPEKAAAGYKQVFRDGFVLDYQLELKNKDNSIRTVLYNASVYTDDQGKTMGVFAAARNITEIKRVENELRKHRDNLEVLVLERTSDLEKSMENLERSNKELEQFAYVASHDLQEPLRMVSSFTQLLEKRYASQLDSDAREFIAYAVDGATRMQKLINDLLDFSRITTRGKEFTKLDLSTILANTLINLHEKIRETGALITNEDLPYIKGDESQMIRLFQNLIDNAIKFRGELTPMIHISCLSLIDYWQIEVKDNGIGVNKEYEDRIFQIFQRLNNDKKYPGTGIGLAVCKRIVERHGGKIWIESEEGYGSTFFFTLKK